MPIPGPARWQALCEALATDNAHLGEALDQARREAEILRRRLGDTPQIELEIGDVQAGNAYRLALSIQRAYRKVPVRIRQPLKNLLQRLL